MKPVQLVAAAILECSAPGVLDAFLGSGTTLMAAERVGRCCYGLELGPHYVDTAIRRWQALTGDAARHARSGMTFEEMAARVVDRLAPAAQPDVDRQTTEGATKAELEAAEMCHAA